MGINLNDYYSKMDIKLSDEVIEDLVSWYMEKHPEGYENFSEDIQEFLATSPDSFFKKEYVCSDSLELISRNNGIKKIKKGYRDQLASISTPLENKLVA